MINRLILCLIVGFDESLGPLYEGEIRRFFYEQLGDEITASSTGHNTVNAVPRQFYD